MRFSIHKDPFGHPGQRRNGNSRWLGQKALGVRALDGAPRVKAKDHGTVRWGVPQ